MGGESPPGESRDAQTEAIAFLLNPCSWPARPDRIEHIETHGAHVFLGGSRVLKVKRARNFGYMNYSTLSLREKACRREIDINRRFAPAIYLRAVAITREQGGHLAIGGAGVPVEWAVEMRRFPERDVLSRVAGRGELRRPLVKALAAAVFSSHTTASRARKADCVAGTAALIASLGAKISGDGSADPGENGKRWKIAASALLGHVTGLLEKRARNGWVRHCHGDLHLNNCVLIDGVPTLFDAIEFDDDLATVDVLYDLAFLLMDLDAAGHRAEANLLLGQYLWLDGSAANIEGLALLPLFLSLRAAIRAMVGFERAAISRKPPPENFAMAPETYLGLALAYLTVPPPRLIAVGGFSGTGKSTLAAALAPSFGAAPGALHLRSDLERKHLAGAEETERLPDSAYAAGQSNAVYTRLRERAALALRAGRSVIVDAVFRDEAERAAIEDVAQSAGAPFHGLWLDAPVEVLTTRVEERRDDASDATRGVAIAQTTHGAGKLAWPAIDASGSPESALSAALQLLNLAGEQQVPSPCSEFSP